LKAKEWRGEERRGEERRGEERKGSYSNCAIGTIVQEYEYMLV
jgi:hypothetical protein